MSGRNWLNVEFWVFQAASNGRARERQRTAAFEADRGPLGAVSADGASTPGGSTRHALSWAGLPCSARWPDKLISLPLRE